MASLYLVDEALAPEVTSVALTGAEAKHAASVARVRVGEYLWISDGQGNRVWGYATEVTPSRVLIAIERFESQPERHPELWLIQALAKGDRDERAIEMATELGVGRIVPWAAARSISRWDGKEAKALERWRTIVKEASKQSIRSRIPVVTELASTGDVAKLAEAVHLLVLHPAAEASLSSLDLETMSQDGRPIAVVVGPEGGLADEELAKLTEAGAHTVQLGPEVLRTSTAGAAAIAVLSSRLARW